jgi:hypothetical protein
LKFQTTKYINSHISHLRLHNWSSFGLFSLPGAVRLYRTMESKICLYLTFKTNFHIKARNNENAFAAISTNHGFGFIWMLDTL